MLSRYVFYVYSELYEIELEATDPIKAHEELDRRYPGESIYSAMEYIGTDLEERKPIKTVTPDTPKTCRDCVYKRDVWGLWACDHPYWNLHGFLGRPIDTCHTLKKD